MKVYFESLGCDKNTVDSEVMLGRLFESGFEFTDDENEAEVAVVNTCCFINDAKEESINTIISLGELRKEGRLKALVIAGCLGQRYTDDVHKLLPEVDAIVGIASIDHIVDALNDVLMGNPKDYIDDLSRKPLGNQKRVMTQGGYFEYLKIAEGCDKHCTYCVIPKVRGQYRSIPMEDLINEAKTLVGRGVKELIIVAQETTIYGMDIYGTKKLPQLLNELSKIDGLLWIRLLYCYPEEITDELIECIANNEKVLNYIDIPIQSGSDSILKIMGRKTNRNEIMNLVRRMRKAIPDICIRTTLICGFPGETEEDHEASLDLVKQIEFDRLGAFTYSQEENTPAATMDCQIDEEIKSKRRDEIMLLQQDISMKKTESFVGKTMDVIIEGSIPEDGVYVGRTYRDAPDVDGYVFVNSDRELLSGDIVKVLILESNEYDLMGEA